MPGVEDATMVDTIGRDKDTGEYKLFLTEYRPWNSEPEQLQQLVVKAANYIQFVKNGELIKQVPEAAGVPVTIVIGYYDVPTPDAQTVLDQLEQQIQGHGLGVHLVKYDTADRPASY
jgi:Family of unknown function (DUF6572)